VDTNAKPPLGTFLCNVCGTRSNSNSDPGDREFVSCMRCHSSIRLRSVVLALSRALFGLDLTLPEFPVLKSVRGLGLSDSDVYADRLESRFSYVNTFYHREPRLDLLHPDEREFGKYDFVICSEVLEHVPAPVDRAFATLARLLKPNGFLILTVPYSLDAETLEHYPGVADSVFAQIDGRTVLVSRSESGEYRVFDNLAFHGGAGSTLEHRLFSDADVRAGLASAGFQTVQFDSSGSREFGVTFIDNWSLPLIAALSPFALNASGVTELVEQLTAWRSSRWLRLGRAIGLGPKLK
jgi:SAM-dependent methyltransferase